IIINGGFKDDPLADKIENLGMPYNGSYLLMSSPGHEKYLELRGALTLYKTAVLGLAIANSIALLSQKWFDFQLAQTAIMHDLAT
ncbi:hypothetical protein ACTPEM_23355, partial [Clostridioides difficile]